MFKNYFKTAWRNLWKNKTMAVINVLGLVTGITCCLLIGLYIQHEYSFDKFQTKGDRIARVIMDYRFNSGDGNKVAVTSTRVLPVFARTFPEIETGMRMSSAVRVVTLGDQKFEEKNVVYADSTFFDLFSFSLSQGNPKQALSGLNKVVLTSSTARKYFGNESPMGKILQMGANATPYEVTGILPDLPSNSQLQFDFLCSFSSLQANQEKTWWNANYTTFLLLKKETDFAPLEAKIKTFMDKDMKGANASITFTLEPFERIHLHSPYDGLVPNTNITYLYILTGVALLILSIACFTYVNLSTARSIDRSREVGIRKAIGALKQQIFRQFIVESFLLCTLSVLVSAGILMLVLPAFSHLSGATLSPEALFSPAILGTIALIVVAISFLAGSYPALVLAAFKPVKVLKGASSKTSSGAWLRKTLIVFQFGISVFLVIGTLIIHQQMTFIRNKKLGYDRDHIVVMTLDNKLLDKYSTLKAQLRNQPGVVSVTRSNALPTGISSGFNMRSATMAETDNMAVTAAIIDEDYLSTMGIELVAGQPLSHQDEIDATLDSVELRYYHYILNESAAKVLGWTPQEAIGKKMFVDASRPGEVKGVTKDFHFQSLHSPVMPLVLFSDTWGSNLLIKISGKNIPATLAAIGATWKSMAPYRPFSYHFLDEDYNRQYESEQRLGTIMNIFAAIAIVLACMGLFGLSYHAMQQRQKEIGIRKVLGASVAQILVLVSSNFLALVLIAFAIAIPATWWAMSSWLQDFAYRINISWIVFAAAGLVVVLIAAVTIGVQAVRAALVNPVKSLKNE